MGKWLSQNYRTNTEKGEAHVLTWFSFFPSFQISKKKEECMKATKSPKSATLPRPEDKRIVRDALTSSVKYFIAVPE